jgi:ADP-ribose pyrophosphatase YjhB (NUDIX family)
MKKGIDFVGVTVNFFCHDGEGNYVMHKRGAGCRDENGCWDFGGGGLKHGETLDGCLSREVKEEYGVELFNPEFLGFNEIFREHEGQKTHWIGFRYRVELNREDVVNAEPEKHDEIGWFTIDEMPMPRHSQVDSAVKKYKDKL